METIKRQQKYMLLLIYIPYLSKPVFSLCSLSIQADGGRRGGAKNAWSSTSIFSLLDVRVNKSCREPSGGPSLVIASLFPFDHH